MDKSFPDSIKLQRRQLECHDVHFCASNSKGINYREKARGVSQLPWHAYLVFSKAELCEAALPAVPHTAGQ